MGKEKILFMLFRFHHHVRRSVSSFVINIFHSNDYNLPTPLNEAALLNLIDRMSLLKISLILLFQNSRSATVRVYFIIFILFKQNSSVIAALRLSLKSHSL